MSKRTSHTGSKIGGQRSTFAGLQCVDGWTQLGQTDPTTAIKGNADIRLAYTRRRETQFRIGSSV